MLNTHSDSVLEVKLDRIVSNYEYLCKKSGKAECSAVVKADCYGLGAKQVVPSLYEVGCRKFFVATLDEAVEVRKFLNKDSKLYVFHGVKDGEEEEFYNNSMTPVINDFYQLEIWSNYSRKMGSPLPAILHIDTGMNRLGFSFADMEKLYEDDARKSLNVEYMMSHLSCITEEGHPLNAEQVSKMNVISKKFGLPCTLSNSRGVIAGEEYHFDMVRPGSMLYGIKGNACHTKIQNVASLRAKIIQIRDIREDSFVGYGAMAAIKKGERIAVVPVGYADGYMRILSNNSHGFIGNHKVPLVGRVSMDMVIFNISSVPQDEVKIGGFVELFGETQRVDELAHRANTIGYEIMTSLGKRYNRVYI